MNRPETIVIAALLWVPAGAQEKGPHVHRDAERGFRIERPVEGWRFLPGVTSGATYSLRMRPRADQGTVEIVVRVRSAGKGEDAAALLQKALARIKADKWYSNLEKLSGDVAGRKATGVRVRFAGPNDTDYHIEQRYLVADGARFILQFHAPQLQWKKYAAEFAAVRKSFQLIPVSAKARTARRLATLADRCGSEIQWAKSWREAADRAKRENKLVMVQVRSYPGFNLPDPTRVIVYMHPDIIEIIGARFVPLRYSQAMAAPFRSQKSYGMSKTTFGQAVLLVTPDGEVLTETSSIHPAAVYDFLVEGVKRFPKYTAGRPPKSVGRGDANRATWHLGRGEFDLAARAIDKLAGARAHRLRASMFRRLRDGEKALAELGKAREAGDASTANVLEEVIVLLRMGRDRSARRALDRHIETRPASAKEPAVLFWKGICDARAKRTTAAANTWRRLMDEHPDNRWAWQAAALASGQGGVQLAWPDETVLATLRTPGDKPLGLEDVATAESAGVAFLLEHQRENGSWISPSEVLRTGAKVPHPFTQAVTAICGRALLQRRQTGGCRDAAKRGLKFLLEYHELVKKHPLPRSYMDYTVWSKAFALWFFADCLAAGLGDADAIAACCLELVADLAKKQKPTGGWSYYVTGDLESEAAATQSISFVTAPVLLALLRARDEGIKVHTKMTDDAMRCLDEMRSVAGVFAYFLHDDGRKTSTGRPGAAGRGPVCELALLRGGKSDVARVKNAVEIFSKYRRGLAKEVGKVLMHAGPDGQGCHYPMFDYAFAAEAIRTMPEDARGPHRAKLIELILATRSTEGAFRDTQFNGWEYGTAMALLALRALRED